MAAMKRRPRRPTSRKISRRGTSASARFWPVVGLIIAVSAIGAGVYFVGATQAKMASDPQTLCPAETGPVAMTAILFDLTDPLTLTQANKLKTYIDKEISDSAVGTQFTMGIVADDPEVWGASSALCKPRSGSDVSALTQNVKLVETRYRERFAEPLQETLDEMARATSSDSSPILEALEGLIAATPKFLTYSGPRRVIIVSDLLQNSEAMSFYRGEDWQSFSASAAFQLVANSLEGADVQLYQIPRPIRQIKDPAVIEDFWVRYFDVQGANLPHLKKM